MQLLTFPELAGKGVRYNRSYIWKLCKIGEFPKPVRLGRRSVAWIESEIDAWLGARIAARDLPPPPPPRTQQERAMRAPGIPA